MNADAGRCFYEGMKNPAFGLVHYTDSPCFTFLLQRNSASRKEILHKTTPIFPCPEFDK